MLGASAQNATMTPYSKYGYGILSDNATSTQKGMGGIGYAMNSGRQINVKNPASYAAIDSLTFLFDMGANLDVMWSQEGTSKEHNFSGGLDYITLAFPITKWMGASIGLIPFSSTGYKFGENIENGTVSREGKGDISQLYGGFGVRPFKGFYVGANFAYMFGTTTNDVYGYTVTGSTSLFERTMKVRDWRCDIGVQYTATFKQDHRITLGATFSPGKDFHGELLGTYYDATLGTTPDTIAPTPLKLKGNYSMPATWGAGINYTWRGKLMLEADFTYQPWAKVKYLRLKDLEATEQFANRWKVALGAQYSPDPRGGYLQRTQYRAGLYYNNDYIMVRGNQVREYGATLGLGLPVPQFKTIINLAFEYRHRQAYPSALVKEDYLCISLGVNFNELWFHQRKLR